MKNQNKKNSSQNGSGNHDPYVRVIESGIFISFKTVNHDWCVINTKMNNRKGQSIVEKEPFTNCRAVLMHLSDFNNWFPRLNEIPITTNWPL